MTSTSPAAVSRRDFLRLRAGNQGRVLEVSCRALFMRCADARLPSQADAPYEPWMGEPPAVIARASVEDLLRAFVEELEGVRTLRLFDAEWLERLGASPMFRAAIHAFEARGGRVERA